MPKKKIPTEQIEAYKRMVDIANKRLKRIEQYAQRPGYEGLTEFAYRRARLDIKKIYGPDAQKFSKKVPKGKGSYREFQKRYEAVSTFIESQSSTLKGIQDTYKRRADTLNKEYGWDLNWNDLAKMFESGIYKKLKAEGYGSETIFKTIAAIRLDEKKFKANKDTVKLSHGNSMIKKIANKFIEENRSDVEEFFKSIK